MLIVSRPLNWQIHCSLNEIVMYQSTPYQLPQLVTQNISEALLPTLYIYIKSAVRHGNTLSRYPNVGASINATVETQKQELRATNIY